MTNSDAKHLQSDFRLCESCQKLHTGFTTCPGCSRKLSLIDHSFFLEKTFGRYTIKKILGLGGMGVVFEGLHTTLNKKVAIKILIPNEKDPSFEKRFLREARIIAGLKHPNIVEVFDFDISQWNPPFYVMEFLQGKNLREEMKEFPNGMPLDIFPHYLTPIIQGLSCAHKSGIVHRDLKPDNIFIEEIHGQKVIKILDFGIAKSTVIGADEATNLTSTQAVLGTPFYLSPEQILNKNIGPHTDQYALALIVAEMLSGEVIRSGKSIGEILYKDVHAPIRIETLNQKRIPGNVKLALVRATDPDPAKRFPDIESFGNAVLNAADKEEQPLPTGFQSKSFTKTMTEIPDTNTPTITTKRTGKPGFLSIEEEVELEAQMKAKALRKKRRGRIILVLLILFLLAGGGALYHYDPLHWFGGLKNDAPPLPKKEPPFLNLAKALTVRKEVSSILTYQGNHFVAAEPGGIYLLDLDKKSMPEQIPLEDRLIGAMPDGDLLFIDKYNINRLNFIAKADTGSVHCRLSTPLEGDVIQASLTGQFLVVTHKKSLAIHHLIQSDAPRIREIGISADAKGFHIHISAKYLAFTDAGQIYAYRLDGAHSALKAPFAQSAIGPMAIDDDKEWLAAAYDQKQIKVYHLNHGKEMIHWPGAKPILSMTFLADAPVLVISKDNRLIFKNIDKNKQSVHIEPGLKAVHMISTPQGLALLDKKDNQIKIYQYDKSRL